MESHLSELLIPLFLVADYVIPQSAICRGSVTTGAVEMFAPMNIWQWVHKYTHCGLLKNRSKFQVQNVS